MSETSHIVFGFGAIGGWELLLIFFIVLLVFGAKRLPEIARSLGKATNEFKRAKNDLANMAEEVNRDEPAPLPRSTPKDTAKSTENSNTPS
ncbi:MAG: twin-arginine translocase TatA/TatE family subunit [Lentisphaeria bacterium]|nr:twin-arginine translocase TatA/TatE family subunit [Lentisphaeria bacterium]